MNIELSTQVKVFWCLVFFSFFIEWMHEDVHKCMVYTQFPLSVISVLVVHHIINTFVLFGWLFNHLFFLILYLSAPFIACFHWKNNNGMCQFSIEVNRNCGFEESTMLNDILKVLHLKTKPMYFIHTYLIYTFVGYGMMIGFIKTIKLIKLKIDNFINKNIVINKERRIKVFKLV